MPENRISADLLAAAPGGVRRFVADFARHAGRGGAAAASLVAIGALLEGVGLALLVPLVGMIVAPERSGAAWLGGAMSDARLPMLLGLFVLVMAVRALMLRWRDLALFDLQARFVESLRRRVIGTLATAPWDRLVRLEHARITGLIASDIPRLSSAAHYLVQGGVAAAMVAIQLALAFALAPRFAAVAVLALIGGMLVLRVAGAGVGAMGQRLVRANHALLGSAGAFIGGLKAAAAQRASDRFADEFDAVQRDLTREQRRFTRRQADARAAMGIGAALAGAAVVGCGVMAGLAPPVLIALAVIFARMAPLVQQLQQAAQQVGYNAPAYDAVRAIEAEFGGLAHSTVPVPHRSGTGGDIELTAATYRHPGGGGGGVEGVSLRIGAGECVGISGPSGGGKTTLIDLVAGLLTPQQGTVAAPRGALGYLPQDAFLFHDSVRRNIGWGDPAYDDAAIGEALRIAGAEELMARLPRGLDTVVGERGALLSGGERQRLGIARAVLRRPSLLILDEATGAIDPAGEAALLVRLKGLTPRPTILLVAHRAESLVHCNRVIRVEGGRIVSDQMTSISAL